MRAWRAYDRFDAGRASLRNWYAGRAQYGRFISLVWGWRGTDWHMLPVAANAQPGVMAYARGDDGGYHAHSLQVFTVTGSGISHTVVFADPAVFPPFGLAPRLAG